MDNTIFEFREKEKPKFYSIQLQARKTCWNEWTESISCYIDSMGALKLMDLFQFGNH